MLYTAENERQLPYCNWSDSGFNDPNAYPYGWLFTNGLGWNQARPPQDGIKTGVIWKYNRNATIYHCPVDDPSTWMGSHWLSSYTMNGAQGGYERVGYRATKGTPGLPLSKFTNPARQVLMWEATDPLWNDGSSYPSEAGITDRHYKGGNVSFFDGHVEWWTPSDYAQQEAMHPSALWCDPLTSNGM